MYRECSEVRISEMNVAVVDYQSFAIFLGPKAIGDELVMYSPTATGQGRCNIRRGSEKEGPQNA